jgi:anti-sigma-K factor RskA
MNCDQVREYYDLYALGIAEEPERSEIAAHLERGCETCREGVRKSIELTALLAGIAPTAEPSAGLRRRILASAGVETRRFPWVPVWVAAAVFALVAAVYFGFESQRADDETIRLETQLRQEHGEVARLNEALAIVSGPNTQETDFGAGQPQPPRGKVFVNPSQGVLLIASNLAPAPSGKLYEMWVIPKTGKPAPAGLFQSEANGTAMHIQRGAVDVGATAAVAVTMESDQGAAQPTSQPLIVAQLSRPAGGR